MFLNLKNVKSLKISLYLLYTSRICLEPFEVITKNAGVWYASLSLKSVPTPSSFSVECVL